MVERGWTTVPGLLTTDEAAAIVVACHDLAQGERDFRDKPTAGTEQFANVAERVPAIGSLIDHPALRRLVGDALPEAHLAQVSFRSPQPGHGEQRLHADDVALDPGAPWRTLVAIIALCEFRSDNGATGFIPGSHRRPDLQRLSGQLDGHPDEVVALGPPGTAFAFSGHVLHRCRKNRSASPRPAIQVVWRVGGR